MGLEGHQLVDVRLRTPEQPAALAPLPDHDDQDSHRRQTDEGTDDPTRRCARVAAGWFI